MSSSRDNSSSAAAPSKAAASDYLQHWADHAARKVLKESPDREQYVVASGITPSGTVHIGNFREVITVDLVARALRDLGKDVRFIYSWDDFDVFRKVPAGMPQQDMLQEHLRQSIADVPDPFEQKSSYADANIDAFESSLAPLGIAPEFIRQSKAYRAGTYAQGIEKALEHAQTIRDILNEHRSEPLADDWLPIAGFCSECKRDDLKLTWQGGSIVHVHCQSCGHIEEIDLAKGGNIKLLWRVDWPMRWAYEGVCFEPGGKDHSSAGGSYDTGKEIVAQVYGGQAPSYVAYDFVRIKGKGGKISSSKGDVVTVADALEIYEPTILRWIFASYRPNTEFQVSFDLDVIKIYEDYDRQQRLAHQALDGSKNDKKRLVARRTLHLSDPSHTPIQDGEPLPFQPPFRALTAILQIYDGDLESSLAYYENSGEVTSPRERELFMQRARCAWNWIENYAPDDFCYRIRKNPVVRELEAEAKLVLQRLVDAMQDMLGDPDKSFPDLRTLLDGTSLDLKSFTPVVYDLLMDRERGPKMSTLVPAMGVARALKLLQPSLGA